MKMTSSWMAALYFQAARRYYALRAARNVLKRSANMPISQIGTESWDGSAFDSSYAGIKVPYYLYGIGTHYDKETRATRTWRIAWMSLASSSSPSSPSAARRIPERGPDAPPADAGVCRPGIPGLDARHGLPAQIPIVPPRKFNWQLRGSTRLRSNGMRYTERVPPPRRRPHDPTDTDLRARCLFRRHPAFAGSFSAPRRALLPRVPRSRPRAPLPTTRSSCKRGTTPPASSPATVVSAALSWNRRCGTCVRRTPTRGAQRHAVGAGDPGVVNTGAAANYAAVAGALSFACTGTAQAALQLEPVDALLTPAQAAADASNSR
jgi:hypothetical protein